MLRRLGLTATLCWAACGGLQGQVPLGEVPDVPAPMSRGDLRTEAASGASLLWQKTLGDRAIEGGFYLLAVGFYQDLLGRSDLEPVFREQLTLGLATAQIALGDASAAREALEAMPEPRGPAWTVRRAAVAFLDEDFEQLEGLLSGLTPEILPAADAGLYHFLRAMTLDHAGEQARADVAFEAAVADSRSEAERALFALARYQHRLKPGDVTDGSAGKLRADIEQYQGKTVAYQLTLVLATVLNQLGRRDEAMQVLQRQSQQLPTTEAELRDLTWLIAGLIAGADRDEGRRAFEELARNGTGPEWQRVALLKLAAVVPETGGVTGNAFQRLLDELLARTPPHPLTEELLFFRAEMALRNRDLLRAEVTAGDLVARFPQSPLRRSALAVLASAAWENRRYRTAAGFISQIRNDLGSGAGRTGLGALMGECYYRAGSMSGGTVEDFRNAAGSYGAALKEVQEIGIGVFPPGVGAGTLFFQRVMSLIRGEDLEGAIEQLDSADAETVDPESRWQAEWNLARFLQLRNRREEAYQRALRVAAASGLSSSLRLRTLWLAAVLSLETGHADETPARVAEVVAFLDQAEPGSIDDGMLASVRSNSALLLARGELAQGRTDEGFASLEKLRSDYPDTRAAIFSYIIQARALAAANRLADAQALLQGMADRYPDSEYAPLALFEAAQQAKARGEDIYLKEAVRLLSVLADKYRDEQYDFPAKLKQADLARELNEFTVAEGIYQHLESAYPNRSDRLLVEMSYADTLMAQAPGDPEKFGKAVARYERLTDLPPPAPIDLRIEAGVKLGYGWLNRDQPEAASRVFWDVYNRFLQDPNVVSSVGATGRYWLARAVILLAEIEERAKRMDKARELYQSVLDRGLPFEVIARGRLARLQPGSAAAGAP